MKKYGKLIDIFQKIHIIKLFFLSIFRKKEDCVYYGSTFNKSNYCGWFNLDLKYECKNTLCNYFKNKRKVSKNKKDKKYGKENNKRHCF